MDPHGVDISAHAVSEGRARGLKVEVGGVEAAERSFVSAGKMALVTSWDVIEHLPHPIEHLASIARMTQAGGLLSLITPDRGSAAARLLGRRWVEYQKPEEHIYFFNRDDVRALLRRAGFEPVDWSTAGKYVTVDFALKRLSAYSGLFRTVAQALGPLAGRMVYVDPLDKLHVIARRMG
jgi:SAM-dependent methyltransferase